jgi:pyruvate dehydrogenase (quinone)
MLVDGLPDFETDHSSSDHSAIAEGAGIQSIHVEQPEDIRDGVAVALGQRGPAFVDLVTDPSVL